MKILMNGEPPYRWAKKAGIYKGLFQYYWQNGKIPAVDTLIKIQKYSGCSLDWLITGQLPTLDRKIKNLRFFKSGTNSGALQRKLVVLFGRLRSVLEKGTKGDSNAIENILSHMTRKRSSSVGN